MGESGKLECEYCGSNFEAAEIEVLYADKEEKAAAAMQAAEEGEAGRRAADYDSDWDTSGLSGDWGAENDNMPAQELFLNFTGKNDPNRGLSQGDGFGSLSVPGSAELLPAVFLLWSALRQR